MTEEPRSGTGDETPRTRRRAPAPAARQRDAERTKGRILRAAMAEFSAKGLAGARVSEIARRAGVNQQLISYYFDGKEGLYRQLGRAWRAHEERAIPDGLPLAETLPQYVRASLDPEMGARLLAWEGLADTGRDDPADEGARERDARLRQEVEGLRERQRAGEITADLDPAALLLITLAAGNALAVYPQLARTLLGDDPSAADRYAAQLARLVTGPDSAPAEPPDA